ncbi:hypothetical protein [Neoroseomonas soli]|uniref:Uncharacterized protein n=1 Tax=Neoroseomonas soli TaxID=1081025 RepID=A0A9X9WW32_9PROT|nr:hypothetical protein [Neoroseomonas soli]MBR0671361.1 hypothetical protein [Neoroseomonas soli]
MPSSPTALALGAGIMGLSAAWGLALAAAASDPAPMPELPVWAAGEAPPASGLLAALEGVSA